MRDNNVDAVDPDAQGLVKLPSDVPQSQIERAEKVCGPNPTSGAQKVDIPDEVRNDPERQALQLKYWTCMRENGFKEPTPNADGSVVLKNSPEMMAAMKACRAEEKRLNERTKALQEQGDR
ncbi:hypothetical protein ABZY19_34040 [Streptomyces sp. NPDC006475]|uniref:hypothetical protein n=1 Tax=Streptomyces sp. NPDC006475 TaxID=3155719 RepID=UPI0033B2C4F8